PIYFYNQPVGSTCTLIAEHFFNSQVPLSKEYAGLMLAGLMTDTMLFKSPTTTGKDRIIASKLEQISGLNGLQWGKDILEKGASFEEEDENSIITSDLKEYQQDQLLFAIAQVEILELHQLRRRQQGLRQAMEELCQIRDYDFMCLMVTAILEESTEL